MATVHLGRVMGAAGFSRVVAIKRLHPHLLDSGKLTAMLIDEARIASRIRHPNVVAMIDVERIGDELLLVMEYVHGPALALIQSTLRLRKESMPVPIALRIAIDVLEGLSAAHQATSERGSALGIVHRDVSPQNILVGAQDGVARLTDFGIAKAEGRVSFTQDGEIKGKLSYMSREQLRGGGGGGHGEGAAIDLRSDVYSLGVVLWEMLTGQRLFVLDSGSDAANAARKAAANATATMTTTQPPQAAVRHDRHDQATTTHQDQATTTMTAVESHRAIAAAEAAAAAWARSNAKNPIELLLSLTAHKPPSTFTPSVSAELDAIVMKALSPEPKDRFSSAEEMANAITIAIASSTASPTMNIATSKDVGEWTRNIASAFLSQRQEVLERIEQVSMILPPLTKVSPGNTEPSVQTVVPSTSPMDHTLSLPDDAEPKPKPKPEPKPAPEPKPEPKRPSGSAAVAPTLIDAPIAVLVQPPAQGRNIPWLWLLALAAVVVGVVVVVVVVVRTRGTSASSWSPVPTASVPGVESETPSIPSAKRRPNPNRRRHPE